MQPVPPYLREGEGVGGESTPKSSLNEDCEAPWGGLERERQSGENFQLRLRDTQHATLAALFSRVGTGRDDATWDEYRELPTSVMAPGQDP